MRAGRVLKGVVLVAFAFAMGNLARAESRSCPSCATDSAPIAVMAESQLAPIAELAEPPKCPTVGEVGLREAREEFRRVFPDSPPLISATVAGRELRGTAEQIALAKRMLRGRLPSTWKKPARACAELLCALAEAFGGSEESALRALTIAKRDGYALSFDQSGHPQGVEDVWKPMEVRSIDRGIQKAPYSFKRLSSLQIITRVHPHYRVVRDENTAATASPAVPRKGIRGEVRMYAWAMTDERSIQIIFLHELAHHVDFTSEAKAGMPMHVKQAYATEANGWVRDPNATGEFKRNKQGKFVTSYAATSAWEDFAETTALYIVDPKHVRATAPEKYELLKKNLFANREYLEDRRWKELEQTLAEAGVDDAALLRECFSEVTSFGLSVGDSGLVFRSGRNAEDMRSFERSYGFGAPARCMDARVKQLAPGLKQYCERGGQAALEQSLMERVRPSLSKLAMGVKAAAKGESEREKDCLKNKDLRRSCRIQPVLDQVALAFGADAAARERVLPVLVDALSSKLELKSAFKGWSDRIGASALVFGCLERTAKDWKISERSYEQPADFRCIQTSYETDLDTLGYQRDPDLKLSYVSIEAPFRDRFKAFREQVFQPALALPSACRKEAACREPELRRLFQAWWESDPAFAQQGLTPERLETWIRQIRWN